MDKISREELIEMMENCNCNKDTCMKCKYVGSDKCFIADGVISAVIDKLKIDGETSDGYHTFNELYHHRAILFATICNEHPDIAWKSLKHDDGSMYKDMFIVGINTPTGQATYHYDVMPYWDLFHVTELSNAPKWDGHSPSDAINRIMSMTIK